MPKRFSSVVGRSFGDGVRDAIRSTGMTQRQIAELLDWEEAKVSDLVKGKGGVTEVELAMLLGLCRETRERTYLQFVENGLEMRCGGANLFAEGAGGLRGGPQT